MMEPAAPTPCAICRGETVWDPTFPPGSKDPEGSWFCPKCRVWTAPSDGREEERRKRYTMLALQVLKERRLKAG